MDIIKEYHKLTLCIISKSSSVSTLKCLVYIVVSKATIPKDPKIIKISNPKPLNYK